MFDLDNFDLDIDNIFSSNLSEEVNFRSTANTQKMKIFEESTSKCESQKKHICKPPTDLESLGSNGFSESPILKDFRESNLKRARLQSEEPQKKRLSHERLIQRKFPGPAGLLPDKPFKELPDVTLLLEKQTDTTEMEDIEKGMVYSQCSGSLFLEPSYQKLLSDFNLNESMNSLNKYTVEWLKKTALNKGFQGKKIPFLGLVVHSVNHTMPDPVVVLRDPTGEVHGSLHREVWADLGGKLKVGIALALRQVGVLITGVIRRQIYLNITMNNILAIYGPSEKESQVEVTTVNKISKSQLLKSLEEWLPQPSGNFVAKSPANSSLFSTVNEDNFPCSKKENINLLNDFRVSGEESRGERRKKTLRNEEDVLAHLGIVLGDGDFDEEMNVAQVGESLPGRVALQGNYGGSGKGGDSSRALSQAESLIFEEVLSGIDLHEFET